MSTSVARPRKKTAVGTYGDLNKTKLKATFDPLWESIKDSVKPNERLRMWNEHVRDCWEKETSEVRGDIMKQTDEENETVMAEWKKKASFTGSPEDLNQ
jgi:regulator of replication initiation timing